VKRIESLVQGYEKFRKKYYGQDTSEFDELVRSGQKPEILMIACCDSRVDPAIVTNCRPGDLFVIRNVANLVPPYEDDNTYHGTSAALEFGITGLGIQHIIVFGHTECGGIKALVENQNDVRSGKGFISKWMELAKPAYDQVMEFHGATHVEEQAHLCGQYSLINSYKNLFTFPWIKERVDAGTLYVHAWYFDLHSGNIFCFDPEKYGFEELRPLAKK
jgi:carbonic anhydrase